MEIQFGTAELDYCSMDYCRFGKGERTLIILPGLSAVSSMPAANAIAQAYKAFADDFTIFVFDRRKGALPEVYTVKDMADDTAQAMQKLNLGNADIFGASQGGMIAMQIAVSCPGLVHSLVIGSSSAHVSASGFDIFDTWIALAKAGKPAELYLSFAEAVYPEDMFEKNRELWIDVSKTVTKEDLARFVILAEGMKGFDIRCDLKKITCPVLVMGSKADKVFGRGEPGQIAKFLTGSTDCELYMYDGYGHAVYDCTPDFPERMLEFLKKHN